MKRSTTSISMALEYDHASGDLTPYFDALGAARALGGRCPSCGRIWVPPRLRCPDDATATEPLEMPGVGRIAAVTQTHTALPFSAESTDHTFVLVAIRGADNLMFGRMVNGESDIEIGAAVCLTGGDDGNAHPAQAAVFKRETVVLGE